MSDAAANLRSLVDPFLEFGDWSAVQRIGEVSFTTVEGYELVVFDPRKRPQLWNDYLHGAIREYRRFDVEKALTLDENSDGHDVSAAFVIRAGGAVVGGIRAHGPATDEADLFALEEVASSPDFDRFRQLLNTTLAQETLIEVKGLWSSYERPDRARIAVCASRCIVHLGRMLGAHKVLATAAVHTSDQLSITGARFIDGIAPSPYPNDRYRTRPMLWALDRNVLDCDPRELATLGIEWDRFLLACERKKRADQWRVEILGDDQRSADQIAELFESGHVQTVDRLPEILADLPVYLLDVPIDDRWIWYPWREQLVRLPGPKLFWRLRTDRNRNKLTTEEQQLLRGRAIGVVGLSVGHVIAYTLAAQSLCGRIKIVDGDRLELTNLNRIPGSVCDLGVNKAVSLARRILELDPYIDVEVIGEYLTEANTSEFLDGLDLVVEECDSLDIKISLRDEARARAIPVLMHTSDRGMLDVERFDIDADRPILHGLIGDLTSKEVGGLTTEDKVPYVLRILDPTQVSARFAASLIEIGEQVETWPQLAEDVVLGGAAVTAMARRILTGESVPSGRLWVDLDKDPTSLVTPAPPLQLSELRETADPEPSDLHEALGWAATRAPSGGNVQPWRFSIRDDHFEIRIDPEKTTGMDVRYRGSQTALGTALFNAEVLAASRGRLGQVWIDGYDGNVRAKLELGSQGDPAYSRLLGALAIRATNRSDDQGTDIGGALRARFTHWAERFGAAVHLVEPKAERLALGEILAAADQLRYLDRRLHAEMMSELRWPGQDATTGIDVRTLGLPPADLAVLDIISRPDVTSEVANWSGGRALGNPARDKIESSSTLLIVCAKGEDAPSLVNAGRTLQGTWLEATSAGLAFHPWSPLFLYAYRPEDWLELVDINRVEAVRELAKRFRSTVRLPADQWPVLVVRVTKPTEHAPTTGRIPYEELMVAKR